MFKKEVTDLQKKLFKEAMQGIIDIKGHHKYYNDNLIITKSKVNEMFSACFGVIFTSLINATDEFKRENRDLIETIVKQYADFENPEVGDAICSQIIENIILLQYQCIWSENQVMEKPKEKGVEMNYVPFAVGVLLALIGLLILVATFPAPAFPLLIGALALEGAAVASVVGGAIHHKMQASKAEEEVKSKEIAATTSKDVAKDLEKVPTPLKSTNFVVIETERAAKKANAPEGPIKPGREW